jgi:hypothetical protein
VEVLPGRIVNVGPTMLVAGDTWSDGAIDILDVLLVGAAVGRCAGDAAYQSWLDLDGDGCVRAADLQIVSVNYGYIGPTDWSAAPSP